MMDEFVYDLLLKSVQGVTLLGTLRFRFSDLDAIQGPADVPALVGNAVEQQYVTLDIFQMRGSISVLFLTGPVPLPLEGVTYSTPPLPLSVPLTTVLNGGDAVQRLTLQFNYLDPNSIAGGLVWQYGTPREVKFSILGTRRAFGL
jgi:hypothetical protein